MKVEKACDLLACSDTEQSKSHSSSLMSPVRGLAGAMLISWHVLHPTSCNGNESKSTQDLGKVAAW